MPFDPTRNVHLLDDIDMPQQRKLELAAQVSLAMENAVDRRFGIDSVQTCLWIRDRKATRVLPDPLDSMDAITLTFNDAAKGSAAGKRCP